MNRDFEILNLDFTGLFPQFFDVVFLTVEKLFSYYLNREVIVMPDKGNSSKGHSSRPKVVGAPVDGHVHMISGSELDASSISDTDVIIIVKEAELTADYKETQERAFAVANKLQSAADKGRAFKINGGRMRSAKGEGKTIRIDNRRLNYKQSPNATVISVEAGGQSAKGVVQYTLGVSHHVSAQPKGKTVASESSDTTWIGNVL